MFEGAYIESADALDTRPTTGASRGTDRAWRIGARLFHAGCVLAIPVAAGSLLGVAAVERLLLAVAITVPAVLFVGPGSRQRVPRLAVSVLLATALGGALDVGGIGVVLPLWVVALAELISARRARESGGRRFRLWAMARAGVGAVAFVLVLVAAGSLAAATWTLAAIVLAVVGAVDLPPTIAAWRRRRRAPRPVAIDARRRGVTTDPGHKRVVVGSAIASRRFEQSLAADGVGRNGNRVSLIDGARVDGQLVERLARETPDEVYFDLAAEIDERLLAKASARLLMDGAAVHFILPDIGAPPIRARTERIGNHAVISLHAMRDGLAARAARRVLDVIGASVLLMLLSPLFGILAVLVWWTMGNPVIHVQQRVGRGGRLFPLYKFRSMVRRAEEILQRSPAAYDRYLASNFKLPPDEDPRITPLGRFLRRASLDELPQLWNVLRGDMSLVGPRAIVPDEVAQYGEYGRMLLRTKPGLTGIWQVSGRSSIGYPERARMDLEYVEGRSLRQDIHILLRTLPAVLRQRGAI